jgi:hypothetical protein
MENPDHPKKTQFPQHTKKYPPKNDFTLNEPKSMPQQLKSQTSSQQMIHHLQKIITQEIQEKLSTNKERRKKNLIHKKILFLQ